MQGVDEETDTFPRISNMASVFGDETFKEWVDEELLPE